ncbi:MAG: chemotaxis protein CheW [Symplocastrum torsivum CPER-KK1]|jgi:chemotaxis family two-component system sensor histidine kinase/response regulator PixL|uniref:histidine kinase n=1 Tax=Symplocastrum torsivum CPER-KK1 TaxID=450513 RepID=A0A951PJ14_9CYAN|nr:chemotaxis protein CheW [Symplocastrum torsivum CPER-KK1]
MAINSDIRDQAYQFFIEEAPDLLQVIEAGLLTLRQEHSTANVHNLMRAAHSIKGGSASVELDAIATLAHRLETLFKVFYDETIEIDTDLESQLLQAYDCLRLPLMEQIQVGYFDAESALALADPIFTQLEEQFGEALAQVDNYMPSSADLGIDMTTSIFDIDVREGLEHLSAVVAQPQNYEVAGELRAQAEVFAGFAELLNQPEFGAIAKTTLAALEAHPERALVIAQLALSDFQLSRQAVLGMIIPGASAYESLQNSKEITPSPALMALANPTATEFPDNTQAEVESIEESVEATVPSLDELFSSAIAIPENSVENTPIEVDENWTVDETFAASAEWMTDSFALCDPETEGSDVPESTEVEWITQATSFEVEATETPTNPLLEEVFGGVFATSETQTEAEQVTEDSPTEIEELQLTASLSLEETPVLDEVFGGVFATSETETALVIGDSATEIEERLPTTFLSPEETPLLDEVFGGVFATSETQTAAEQVTEDSPTEIEELQLTTSLSPEETPVLEEVFGGVFVTSETQTAAEQVTEDSLTEIEERLPTASLSPTDIPQTLEGAVQSIEEIFESLPSIQDILTPTAAGNLVPVTKPDNLTQVNQLTEATPSNKQEDIATPQLSVRVDSNRLGRMNNLVGELAINRNGLSLQNDQLQGSVRELLNRFTRVQSTVSQLQALSDQMLVSTSSAGSIASHPGVISLGRSARTQGINSLGEPTANSPWINETTKFGEQDTTDNSNFDSLELDSYGFLHLQLQGLLDDMVQFEEAVDDIVLFAKATDQSLEQQRQMLTQLRDELMWARMLPLGEVLNRYPRMLRDLSTTYRKPVLLKLSGTSVLVDKAVLEKLYDPLLHLLRNAFDHGIEAPEIRIQQGKSAEGLIEVRAYHQGSQTIIEVRDDGQGLNLERIRTQAQEMGLLSAEQAAAIPNNQLFELIFEPGFSTASQVSELSGRGVGLDVVRAQMRSLKGTITVSSSPGVGTTFTLRLPLTLTIAKLLVCFIGSTALAMPSDSIEEIIVPKAEQIKESGTQRFLHWRGQIVPTYRLADLLEYACPLPDTSPSKALISVASPASWSLPLLILRQGQQVVAMEIDRLVTEQELVIKPFGSVIAPPTFTYGCTILGDGSLIPVIDTAALLNQILGQNLTATATTIDPNSQHINGLTNKGSSSNKSVIKTTKAPTVLVVDDAAALRRTLALTLERAGYRVLQARDGREAIEQLQQSPAVNLVVCDIEMPNMNGFEFLSCRRQDLKISKIPVVMLTSRSNDKHRWLAMQLGATAYFTKPYLEQDFVAAIKQIISQNSPESDRLLLSSHSSQEVVTL